MPAPQKRHNAPHSAVKALQESCAAADTLKQRSSIPEGQPAIAHGSQKVPISASNTKVLQTRPDDVPEISSPRVAKSATQPHESDNVRSRSPSAHDRNLAREDPSQRPVGRHSPPPPQKHKVQRGSSFDQVGNNVGSYQWNKVNHASPTRLKRRGVGNPGTVRDSTGFERLTKSLPASAVLDHAEPVHMTANLEQGLSVLNRGRRSSGRESTTQPAA